MSAISLPYQWRPRAYQAPAWEYFEGPEEGKRAICGWHRRAGKDLFGINLCSVKAHERVGVYWHLFPTYKQGRKIIWNGFTRDGRKFLSYFPAPLVESMNGTEMRVKFKNGSIYEVVGTDNVDNLVGANPFGVIFSEYSVQDPSAWDLIRPMLSENGGWALFIYTARGRNHGYELLQLARKHHRWFTQILVAGSGPECTKKEDGTPVISDEQIQEERDSGMPEELVLQEYKMSFDAPLVGAYYSSQMRNALAQQRITRVPHEPRLPVNTYWDLGKRDSTAIWFVQQLGGQYRVIDYYERSGESIPHYAKTLQGQTERYERFGQFTYGTHYAPWDIEIEEISDDKSRIEVAREHGIKFRVVRQHKVQDGIEAVRNIIPQCWFDEEYCARGIECLRGYRKEWDPVLKHFADHPFHDWTSHGADAFRTFAWGSRTKLKGRHRGGLQRSMIDNHNYLAA